MSATTSTPPAFDRALAAQRDGRADEAIAAYRDALRDDPGLAAAHFNLGQLLRQQGALPEASDCFAAAARLRPAAADAWLNLGLCEELSGAYPAAARSYRVAIRLAPDGGTAQFNLGNVLKKQGDLSGAITAYREAARLHPTSPEVQLNIGNTFREHGRPAEAVEALRSALTLRPDWVEARWNLSLALLAAGRLAEGWELYDARWLHQGLPIERGLPWPLWNGEPVDGKRLLVWREQGIGDEIMFATCLPDLLDRGARVTLSVEHRLVPMFARAFPEVDVVADPDWDGAPFDYHAPLGSLPRWLRPNRASFASPWSMLMPDRGHVAAWAERLRAIGPKLFVGLCWRSGVTGGDRSRHYAQLAEYEPLLRMPGVSWVSLQYDDAEAELATAEARTGVRLHRWSDLDQRNDLDSVSALVWNLDLVISAPTAVASLAGAVGVETWQVDSGGDWTTFGESRSPWLPAIRLFRRPSEATSWTSTINELAEALTERLAIVPDRRATRISE